jgi:hypothetical protein
MHENIYFIVNSLYFVGVAAAGGFALYCLVDYVRNLF